MSSVLGAVTTEIGMKTADLKELQAQLKMLPPTVRAENLIMAIECALRNPRRLIAKIWLREELDKFHAAHC